MSENPITEPAPTAATSEEKQWAMFAHLAGLVATSLGGMGFLGPLVVWLIKKDQMKFVDDQGKEALNFQLNLLVALIAVGVIGIPLTLLTFGFGALLVGPLALGLAAIGIVFPILAAVKANSGEAYRYPYIIRVIT